MRSKIPIPPPGFDELSGEEKLDYLDALWEHVAARPADVPVPAWHLQIIRERLNESEGEPEAGTSWEETRTAIEERLGSKAK